MLLSQIPNLLTLVRVAACPVLVLLLYEGRYELALYLFIVAGITDGLDGFIAKRFDCESKFGAVLDPSADKLLIASAYIMLAIQRMRSLELLDESQSQNHHFDEDDFWQGKFGLFPGEQAEVVLQFTKSIRHHIEGRLWHASQILNDSENGELILTMNVGLSPELSSWILGWGEQVLVKKPIKLRKNIAQRLKNNLKLYT